MGWTPEIPEKMPAKNIAFIAVFEEAADSPIEVEIKNDRVRIKDTCIFDIDVSGNGELHCDSDIVGTGIQIRITDKSSVERCYSIRLKK